MFALNFRDSLRTACQVLNPFYRNPIIASTDFSHLEGERQGFLNPHVDRSLISAILVGHVNVSDALRDLDGEFLVEAVIVEDELRVNLYPVLDGSHTHQYQPLYNRYWMAERIAQFALDVTSHRATLQPIDGPVYNAFCDRFAPEKSLTLPLSQEDMRLLGLKFFG